MLQDRTIYLVNGSIPSWRVLMALTEKGLPFETKRLRVMSAHRETRTPEFLALNPRGQTPLLIEPDNTTIDESLAILHYLDLRYPTPALLPPPEHWQEYANAIAWVQQAETFICAYAPMQYLFLKQPSDMNDDEQAKIKTALAAVTFDLHLWEKRAKQHTFIASESFTLADCSFYPVLAFLMRRGLTLENFPKLQEYELRVRQRASAQAARPEGWLYDRTSKPNLFRLAAAL